jgi:hypothetical protein
MNIEIFVISCRLFAMFSCESPSPVVTVDAAQIHYNVALQKDGSSAARRRRVRMRVENVFLIVHVAILRNATADAVSVT